MRYNLKVAERIVCLESAVRLYILGGMTVAKSLHFNPLRSGKEYSILYGWNKIGSVVHEQSQHSQLGNNGVIERWSWRIFASPSLSYLGATGEAEDYEAAKRQAWSEAVVVYKVAESKIDTPSSSGRR